ncbi:MAG: AAA family ATPase [Rhodospirillaceae bacterium]
MHLSNIVQFEDKPALFDAMAFNDLFAVIDRLYDLSFLLMDLDFRGERRLASIVLNHYMEYSGDTEGMALLPLYLSTRASVRALVAATAAGEQSDDSLRRELEAEAKRYMEAAEDYLLPAPPGVIAVGGLSGSGKSRLAREVAPYLDVPGALVLRTDVLRKRLVGQDPYDGLGPEGYTADMSRKTYELLYAEAKRALDIGRTVVLDGVFANPLERQAAEDLARQEGVPFTGLWVEAPVDVAQDRIATRIRNPSDVTREVRQKQEGFDLGEITWVRIDSSGPKEDTVSAGLEALAGMRTV